MLVWLGLRAPREVDFPVPGSGIMFHKYRGRVEWIITSRPEDLSSLMEMAVSLFHHAM